MKGEDGGAKGNLNPECENLKLESGMGRKKTSAGRHSKKTGGAGRRGISNGPFDHKPETGN